MFKTFEQKSLYIFVILVNRVSEHRGQGSLEYMAIAVGLIAFAGVGFKALGTDFFYTARKALCQEFADAARATCT